MNEDMQQRLNKLLAYAEHAREEIHEALFLLAALEPLVRDFKILNPFTDTYGAHTLNLLQWTLFRTAVLNLCSGVLDKNDQSGSIKALMGLLDSADLIGAIRAERSRPYPGGSPPANIDPELWAAMESNREEEERIKQETSFDDELPKLRSAFEELSKGELAKRLWSARSKVIAHGNVAFDNGTYRGSLPEDFGLKWGDAEEFSRPAAALIEQIFVVLFGHHLSLEESKEILAEYSEDFWRHLRQGLEIEQQHAANTKGSV